jgi:hypothetical protein
MAFSLGPSRFETNRQSAAAVAAAAALTVLTLLKFYFRNFDVFISWRILRYVAKEVEKMLNQRTRLER